MSREYTHLLWDLDGTLTSPRVGIVRCIQHALSRTNRPSPPEDELLWTIGPPLSASFAKLAPDASPMQVADLIALYRERFSEVGIYENAVYPGISEMLTALTKFRHFVATSKPEVYARRIVEHFGLSNHFEQIYGSELSGERADKGDLLEFIMTAETPQAALMIGDREHDVIGARKVGIPCLGVAWGYGSHDELLNAGAIAVVDSPRELIDRLS